MDDAVGVAGAAQDLVGALARGFTKAGGLVEHFLPGFVVGDFVNDQDVRHRVSL